jgi:hypothetical protein
VAKWEFHQVSAVGLVSISAGVHRRSCLQISGWKAWLMSRLKWLVGPHPPYWRQSGAHSFAILGNGMCVFERKCHAKPIIAYMYVHSHAHIHPHRVSSAHYLRIFDAYFININPRCVHAAVTRRRRPFGFVARQRWHRAAIKPLRNNGPTILSVAINLAKSAWCQMHPLN